MEFDVEDPDRPGSPVIVIFDRAVDSGGDLEDFFRAGILGKLVSAPPDLLLKVLVVGGVNFNRVQGQRLQYQFREALQRLRRFLAVPFPEASQRDDQASHYQVTAHV